MAEPVSGVITLITFSLVIIRETRRIIRETSEVDNKISKILAELEDVEKYMVLVEEQCNTMLGRGESVPRSINDSLVKLRPRLEDVQQVVRDLASRESGTLYQRFKLKIRAKVSEKDPVASDKSLDIHDQINGAENAESRLRAVQHILKHQPVNKELVEKKDKYGRTPLFAAIRVDDIRLARIENFVRFLIEQGVDEHNVSSETHRKKLEEIKETIEFEKKNNKKRKEKMMEQKPIQTSKRGLSWGSKKRSPI
ncbi:hypothetical protein N0V90_004921 [Kalmusia sp. IMI 367209]|nr:hypothetical protein N0V90_004921 [Kalmusia sp. IMI 367209]